MYVYIHTYVYVCMYVYIYIYMYICIYVMSFSTICVEFVYELVGSGGNRAMPVARQASDIRSVSIISIFEFSIRESQIRTN